MTIQAIPGVLEYEGARIQLLDLPGIVQDAAKGQSARVGSGQAHPAQAEDEVGKSYR